MVKKILFICPRFPYPPKKGDQIVALSRIKSLSRNYKITLVSFLGRGHGLSDVDYMRQYCDQVIAYKFSYVQAFLGLLLGIFSNLPYQVCLYRNLFLASKVGRLAQSGQFKVIYCSLLRMWPYANLAREKVVVDMVDSMQLNFEGKYNKSKGLKRFIYGVELKRLKRYEPLVAAQANANIFVSSVDAYYVHNSGKTCVIPLVIDVDKFYPAAALPNNYAIAFSGNMAYEPNKHALEWFIQFCMPRIVDVIPDARLYVIGRGCEWILGKYPNQEYLKVVGEVDCMAEQLRHMRVAIAPMQSGSGMQFKILEAMACGLPVVATSKGLGGIAAEVGRAIFVEDDASLFADRVIALFKNDMLSAQLGDSARSYILSNHTESCADLFLDSVIDGICV